jgi:hypothetical protein
MSNRLRSLLLCIFGPPFVAMAACVFFYLVSRPASDPITTTTQNAESESWPENEATVENIRVRVVRATVGPYREADGMAQSAFRIALNVSNLSDTQLYNVMPFDSAGTPTLTDNFGNRYLNMIRLRGEPFGLHPRHASGDLVLFDPPIESIQWLRLTLPGRACGISRPFRIQLPAASVRLQWKEDHHFPVTGS